MVLGKSVKRPSKLDRRLVKELKALSDTDDPYDTVSGKTMCTYDFYEGELFCCEILKGLISIEITNHQRLFYKLFKVKEESTVHFVTLAKRTKWNTWNAFTKQVLSILKWNHYHLLH